MEVERMVGVVTAAPGNAVTIGPNGNWLVEGDPSIGDDIPPNEEEPVDAVRTVDLLPDWIGEYPEVNEEMVEDRDRAYNVSTMGCDLVRKYKLHLMLTAVCREAGTRGRSLEEHVRSADHGRWVREAVATYRDMFDARGSGLMPKRKEEKNVGSGGRGTGEVCPAVALGLM
eukprot:TRINITY_DN6629_c0_g1_i1.p1 TRINITY_DN6629_c0_g1~~TRINITY_DN6629_c0_g1_i1.p1  ORF type:complete len:171 (+),score=38.60 TRINITY_DN6629_c0_g1_i1:1-513(+)